MVSWAGCRPSAKVAHHPKSSVERRNKIGFAVIAALTTSVGAVCAQPGTAAAMATPLEASATKYIEFRNDLSVIDTTVVDNPQAMRNAHLRLASHDPGLLSSGWVAYAALVAADTPAFVESIQRSIAKPKDKEAFLTRLRMDPRSVRELPGAQEAIDAVMAITAKDATKINAIGETFIDRAYSMQNVGWAKRKLPEGMSRVYEARDYASSRERMETPLLPATVAAGAIVPTLGATEPPWQPLWSDAEAEPQVNPRATPIIDRILVLAARYSVGDLNQPVVDGYAKSDQSRRCLNMAMLNFDQCMAATRTAYEEAFCIGEHGLNDVSSCLGWVAGAGDSDE